MNIFKKISPHLLVLVFFVSISFIYFSPLIEGKKIEAHDTKTWKGISKEVRDFRDDTGEEPNFISGDNYKGSMVLIDNYNPDYKGQFMYNSFDNEYPILPLAPNIR